MAIDSALGARAAWAATPISARAAVLLRAASLLSHTLAHTPSPPNLPATAERKSYGLERPRRAEILAATMLGQGKNVWQAEIDAGVELIDFLRFSALFAMEIAERQPQLNDPWGLRERGG